MACNEDGIEKNVICSEALEQVFQKAGEHRWRLLSESKHSTFNSNKKLQKLHLLAEVQSNIEGRSHDENLVSDVIKILKRGESDSVVTSGFFRTRTKTTISECLEILNDAKAKLEAPEDEARKEYKTG